MDSEGLETSLQTPPGIWAKLDSDSSSDKSVVVNSHVQINNEASMELDDHRGPPPSFVYPVLDDDEDEDWKYWNNPSEWKKSSTDRLDSTAMRSSVESDAVCSIATAEPLVEFDSLPHTERPEEVIEGSNGKLFKTSAADVPTNRLVRDAFEVALEMDDARVSPDIPLSPPESGNASKTSSTLPSAVRALLDEWYAREGHRKPLPCATKSHGGTVNCDWKGRPAIYTFNKEVLTVDLFPVPRFGKTTGEQENVMVAHGATVGWVILGYLRTRNDGSGSHVSEYRIWKGTRCQDPNGWDESVLVQKKQRAGLPTNLGKHGRGLKPSMPSSRPSVAQNVSQAGPEINRDILRIPSSSPIPSKIRMLINEWCLLQGPGHALPFATTIKNPQFSSSHNGTPAYFKHDNGTILDVALYPLDSQRPQDQGCSLIIAQGRIRAGRGSGPFLIMQSRTGEGRGRTTCIYYYTWIGVSGDIDGFAYEFTIAKYFGRDPQIEERNTLPTHEPLQMTASAVVPLTGSPSKRRRLDRSTDSSLESSPSLDEHVRNHTVLLFFSANNKTPRVRLLGTCDSMQKLFAQASAGELFHESGKRSHILHFKLAGQQGAHKVIEDDTYDFESLLIAITKLSCWNVIGDKIEGSCTVEVRAWS